ncbi:Hypothetical predicted protein [Mytilus galloprovincialis]|uniref:Uncharacterized protein n=1 Tax=Mytilus galloprovincialis TaxID=29158 RepID=A0A8B6EDD7_MYTGA|nr:Hypothetical predicted protein [Mytilus galloprovincialis]
MELQLHVCDKEYKSFQNDHLRDLWPAVWAYCNKEECEKKQLFRSFNEYKSHFRRVHKEKLILYTCQICDLSRRKLQSIYEKTNYKNLVIDKLVDAKILSEEALELKVENVDAFKLKRLELEHELKLKELKMKEMEKIKVKELEMKERLQMDKKEEEDEFQ